MEKKRHRLRQTLLITFSILFGLIALVIIFLSPIVKYMVEKYDKKYTGREITMDWAYVNPFTGYVHFDDLKFFEYKSDSVFFSSGGISARLDMWKLFSKEYEIKYLTLDKPIGVVIQHTKDTFNFSDLIEKFSKKPDDEPKKDTATVKFSLLGLEINDGTFYMKERMTPINYYIKKVNIRSSGMRWDADTIATDFSFESGIGSGTVEGKFNINTKSSDYKTHVIIRRLDLKIIEQYMKDMANYGTLTAMINADITAKGNTKDARNVDAVGGVGIYNFHFGKSPKEDFAAFDKFVIKINHLNPRKQIYIIDSISLVKPYAKYEKYDYLDNIQQMFGKKGENVKEVAQSTKFNLVIEIANYVQLLAKNFFQSNYRINRLGIYRGNLKYVDYSINEKFTAALNPITITADSLSSNKRRAVFKVNSGIQPYGHLNVKLSINPKDSSDFELSYNLEKVNAALLNPFLLSFTSFPLDRGSIEFKGDWDVDNGMIKSNNHLLIIDPRISNRMKANDNKWLPLKFVMFFVRERGNAIDYEIPITGNLKDPKFHLRDVIFDVVSNVFIKPATTPYRFEIKNIENRIEKVIAFNWEFGSADLLSQQDEFIERVVQFLKDNPAAKISVFPFQYVDKEKEYISFFEAKKKYFLLTQGKGKTTLSQDDSVDVSRMSVKDSTFVLFMRKKVNDNLMFTNQQLCRAFAGPELIDQRYNTLLKEREKVFMESFSKEGLQDRVVLKPAQNKVPFNGFSYYQISYDGQIPEDLKQAFKELEEYDSEKPRKKLLDERQKTRRFFNFKNKK